MAPIVWFIFFIIFLNSQNTIAISSSCSLLSPSHLCIISSKHQLGVWIIPHETSIFLEELGFIDRVLLLDFLLFLVINPYFENSLGFCTCRTLSCITHCVTCNIFLKVMVSPVSIRSCFGIITILIPLHLCPLCTTCSENCSLHLDSHC
jgi:hypothetical protein